MSQDIQIGDTVQWTSQAGGNTKTKEGRVVAIVPPGQRPTHKIHGTGTTGSARNHPSYVVEVKRPKSVQHYWPRVSTFKHVSKPS